MKRQLIIDDESESDQDNVPLVAMKKAQPPPSARPQSTKKAQTNPVTEPASRPASRTRTSKKTSPTPSRPKSPMIAKTYRPTYLLDEAADRCPVTSTRSFIMQRPIDIVEFNSLCNVVRLLQQQSLLSTGTNFAGFPKLVLYEFCNNLSLSLYLTIRMSTFTKCS